MLANDCITCNTYIHTWSWAKWSLGAFELVGSRVCVCQSVMFVHLGKCGLQTRSTGILIVPKNHHTYTNTRRAIMDKMFIAANNNANKFRKDIWALRPSVKPDAGQFALPSIDFLSSNMTLVRESDRHHNWIINEDGSRIGLAHIHTHTADT